MRIGWVDGPKFVTQWPIKPNCDLIGIITRSW